MQSTEFDSLESTKIGDQRPMEGQPGQSFAIHPVSIPERTTALVRGLSLVLEHHRASETVRRELDRQLHCFLDTSSSEEVWLKRAKHTLATPFARYLGNEPPPPPDSAFEASGVLRAWMRPRLAAFCRSNTHLWYSWFQAKRASLPASDEFVRKTYSDHFAALTSPDPGDDVMIDEIFSDQTFRRLLSKLRDEITEKISKTSDDDYLRRRTSTSACFEQTRSGGGQNGELRRLAGMEFDDPNLELHSMHFFPVVYGKVTRYNVVLEVRVTRGLESWRGLIAHAQRLDLTVPVKCTIQAVLEPFKVRVISKGEALPYYLARPLQRAMHSSMRGLDCFRLIGRSFSATDFIDLAEMSKPTYEWFSVDYSAATDGLSWKYSSRILRYLTEGLPLIDQSIAFATLGPHALHYPSEDGGVENKGVQTNGQLMGSILSFPVLCLANLGVYLRVTRDLQSSWTDEEKLRHVLVNGDDMVYCAPQDLWSRHIDVGNAVGLKMSVGKAYHHPVYANVNSTSVHYDLRALVPGHKVTPWRIEFLNTGLFFGQHKVQGKSDDGGRRADQAPCSVATDCSVRNLYALAHMSADPARGLVVNLNTVLQGCLPGKQRDVLDKFLQIHSADIRRECSLITRSRGHLKLFTRNMFLPIQIGGMGVVPPVNWRYKVTPHDRFIAHKIVTGNSAPISSQRPLPGWEIEAFEPVRGQPWSKPTVEKVLQSCRGWEMLPKSGLLLKYGECLRWSTATTCVLV